MLYQQFVWLKSCLCWLLEDFGGVAGTFSTSLCEQQVDQALLQEYLQLAFCERQSFLRIGPSHTEEAVACEAAGDAGMYPYVVVDETALLADLSTVRSFLAVDWHFELP